VTKLCTHIKERYANMSIKFAMQYLLCFCTCIGKKATWSKHAKVTPLSWMNCMVKVKGAFLVLLA